MRNLRKLAGWLLFLLVLASSWTFWPWRAVDRAPGVLVTEVPAQHDIAPRPLPPKGRFTITAVADFDIRARVLGGFRYHSGDQARLAPVDLAVGWGPMSDSVVIEKLKVTQGNRFFFYRWKDDPPLPLPEIQRHSTNLHAIAATKAIAWKIAFLRRGDVVHLTGHLVNVDGPDGWKWRTSLSREDSGNGACELLYVTALELGPRRGS